jgi:hypothetical protein
MSEERDKRLAQLKQAYEIGILDEDTFKTAVGALDVAAGYQAEVQSGAAAQGAGSRALGERGVQVSGNVSGNVITGNIYNGGPTQDPAKALRIYGRVLAGHSSLLPLRGVEVETKRPDRCPATLRLQDRIC